MGEESLLFFLADTTSPLDAPTVSSWLWRRVIGFLGILAAGGYFLTQQNKKRRFKSSFRGNEKVIVSDTCPLGNRQFLVVAECGNEKFLLGVSPSNVSHLATLSQLPSEGKSSVSAKVNLSE